MRVKGLKKQKPIKYVSGELFMKIFSTERHWTRSWLNIFYKEYSSFDGKTRLIFLNEQGVLVLGYRNNKDEILIYEHKEYYT